MSKTKQEQLLDSLLNCYINEQNVILQNTPSFFAIIKRSYDEDLISRFLAYILKNDYAFVEELLKYYFGTTDYSKIKNVEVFCEKTMNSGRADIFLKIYTDKTKYTLTIENKIFSGIHGTAEDDDQTVTYYRFVDTYYNNNDAWKNAFLLLKPEFNPTQAKCDHFKLISYKNIIKWISADNPFIDNSKITDFKNHIEEYLIMSETKFTDTDKKVLANLYEYRQIIQATENAITTFRDWLFRNVSKEFLANSEASYNYFFDRKQESNTALQKAKENCGFINDFRNDVTCCKFYRIEKWYKQGNKDGYWFYVEIKFNNNDPKFIVVQSVIKRYGKKPQESVVKRFIESNDCKIYVREEAPFYIFDTQEINQNIDEKVIEPFTPKWQNEVKTAVVQALKKQCDNMDEIFTSFEIFLQNSNEK